jgi:hypothetical protein
MDTSYVIEMLTTHLSSSCHMNVVNVPISGKEFPGVQISRQTKDPQILEEVGDLIY